MMMVVVPMQMIIMIVNGNCLSDVDGDLVCDENEVAGCQDSTACNYDETATDEGSCIICR